MPWGSWSALRAVDPNDAEVRRMGVEASMMPLGSDVGFDQQGMPMRVDRSDVMRMSPLIEQGLEAGRKVMADPRAFLQGEAPLQDPVKNATEIPEENPMMGAIKAYHGSPHDFDKFDLSKIGTGEGAQAYGHGLYFAENEGVAKNYKEQLTHGMSGTAAIGGKEVPISTMTPAQSLAVGASGWPGDPIENLNKLKPGDLYTPEVIDEAKRLIQAGGVGYRPAGRVYQVSINADPEHFLDWDRPLSEQSEKVRPLLMEAVKNEAYNRALASTSKPRADELWAMVKDPLKAPAGFAQELLRKPEVIDKLRSAGIPGIKYLDQGSRAAGEGSRNYVVFDDKTIDILKKYGIAGFGMLGALQGADLNQRQ